MEQLYYKIANSVLCLKTKMHVDLSFFSDFSIEGSNPDFTAEFVPFETFASLKNSKGMTIYEVECLDNSLTGWAHSFRTNLENSEVYLACNEDWSYGIIGFEKENISYQDMPSWAGILLFGFYTRICSKNILLMHASAVAIKDEGIVFIGPSNIGKTTQAELWHRYENADILNGDKVFLQIEKNQITVFGNPWKGSSPYYLNKAVKVDPVVALRKGETNKIVELSDFEKMVDIIPHVFLPHWDAISTDQATHTLDLWLRSGSFYKLTCRPDREAVELVKKIVF